MEGKICMPCISWHITILFAQQHLNQIASSGCTKGFLNKVCIFTFVKLKQSTLEPAFMSTAGNLAFFKVTVATFLVGIESGVIHCRCKASRCRIKILNLIRNKTSLL